jgi:hypothetical protein
MSGATVRSTDDNADLHRYLIRSSRREHRVLAGLPVTESAESLRAQAEDVSSMERIRREVETFERSAGQQRLRAGRRLPARIGAHMSIRAGETTERIRRWQVEATVNFRGHRRPYLAAPSLLADLADPADRRELSAEYWRATANIVEDLGEVWTIRRRTVAELGYPDYADAYAHWLELDLPRVAELASRTIAETDAAYRSGLARHLGDDVTAGRPLHHCDLPRLFRGAHWDRAFPARSLLTTALAAAEGLGADLRTLPGVTFDLDDRPGKFRRPCCVAVTAPGEVHVLAVPTAGQRGYEEVLHEFGHAAHFALTDKRLPWELRLLPDDTVAESIAYLFAQLLCSPEFLTRRVGMNESAATDFAAYACFLECAMVRRYCAKVLFEMEAHRTGDLPSAGARYVWWQRTVAGVEVPAHSMLTDTDPGLYAVQYLLAWFVAAQIRERLAADFGPIWFDCAEARAELRGLWSRACSHTPATWLSDVTGARSFDTGPLCRSLTMPATPPKTESHS